MNARRTEIKLIFDGVNVSADINKYLSSLSYTDNEEDNADDLQITIDDKDDVWLGDWLNTPAQAPTISETETATNPGGKGTEIAAIIIQKNWTSYGADRVLDCGIFEIDDISGSGPPTKVTIKATSIPYTSTLRTQKKTKAWEQFTLSNIAHEIAGKNEMKCLFETRSNPFYRRKEQLQESDITFLQRLCKNAGISLKVTAKALVLFDAATYEQKATIYTIKKGSSDVKRWNVATSAHDTAYNSCRVKYTDPTTQQTYEASFLLPTNAKRSNTPRVLEINEKVDSNADAMILAEKRLREKNKFEFTGSFEVVGNPYLVSGVTVDVLGYGAFDGKYIIGVATHNISQSGYTTNATVRQVLEGY